MKRLWIIIVLLAVLLGGGFFSWRYLAKEREEQAHFERAETMLIVSNLAQAALTLFRAGMNLDDAKPVDGFQAVGTWLKSGNYFLRAEFPSRIVLYPIAIPGYRSGPDADGNFTLTIRTPPTDLPPKTSPVASDFTYVPPGPVLLGDRLNPREPHFVWIQGFFISPFEVSNQEFKTFWEDPHGYGDDRHWTEDGNRWKQANPCRATALLKEEDKDFKRFGELDQPVVLVNWFEADAFCHWLTWKFGKEKWIFSLPTEAEWEKAARGPDNFDYALGASISDREVPYYNWKKNPGAVITVIGSEISSHQFLPNRYGLYHMTGNVSEWTQTLNRPYNRERPYADDDRNRSDLPGTRVVRGGSWYTASTAVLYIPYRETFQPEVSAPYLGFRVVARLLPMLTVKNQ